MSDQSNEPNKINTDKPYQVFTPAGIIYCESALDASFYKEVYGWPWSRNPNYKRDEND